ncbi:hypothetical protein B0T26DRAFT_719921 [Lasiosphaeria miniovina]|uniref:Geranylgeranyl transferase type-2 subunit alpha n=1 Tax=Lasiosphaeria miniovina TaxID=1954250 RepID=A0AA40DR41_9PEZI|nr:uncharacterized protein B0T26DRAFT_719921 [Lasiosphaeria miniovina]KAK0708948.1 hypothetical protein B0T26DRAFT_719921 [Lasiosphaeria miniovina]
MADYGGSQHGIARTSRAQAQTADQRKLELDRIEKYRDLENQVRSHHAQGDYSPDVFQLTTRLLRLNPEYYTIWNVRRRSLISGLLSKPSHGSAPSRVSQSSSPSPNTAPPSANLSPSFSAAIQPFHEVPTVGRTGTTADSRDSASPIKEHGEESTENEQQRQQQDLDILVSELRFTIPLLLEAPKCYWIWSHRSWVLQEAIGRLQRAAARRIWEEELGLVSKMLFKDRRNFHAWGYRRHVVDQLEGPTLGGISRVESEFEYTTQMIETDLSNFSAWHGRSKLIPRMLDERGADDEDRKAFLDKELGMINEALNVGPEDQSLWYYHQFLMLNLVSFVGRATIVPTFNLKERITYMSREIEGIKELLEDYNNIKLIYEALLDYTIMLCQLEERQPDTSERADLAVWLQKLRELDPMRNGRWSDVARDYGLQEKITTPAAIKV